MSKKPTSDKKSSSTSSSKGSTPKSSTYQTPLQKRVGKARRVIHPVPGCASKYKPEYDTTLIRVLSEGNSKAKFCAKVGISINTFDVWREVHPTFDEAYQIGMAKAEAWWEEKLMDNLVTGDKQTFCAVGWSMTMRNRFGYTEHRKLSIPAMKKAKSALDQIEVIKEEISKGRLTAQEANSLGSFASNSSKINMENNVEERVTQLEASLNEQAKQN